jgi:hypothetical protein
VARRGRRAGRLRQPQDLVGKAVCHHTDVGQRVAIPDEPDPELVVVTQRRRGPGGETSSVSRYSEMPVPLTSSSTEWCVFVAMAKAPSARPSMLHNSQRDDTKRVLRDVSDAADSAAARARLERDFAGLQARRNAIIQQEA